MNDKHVFSVVINHHHHSPPKECCYYFPTQVTWWRPYRVNLSLQTWWPLDRHSTYTFITRLISLETYLDLCIFFFLCHSLLTLVFHFCHLRWGGDAGRATGTVRQRRRGWRHGLALEYTVFDIPPAFSILYKIECLSLCTCSESVYKRLVV